MKTLVLSIVFVVVGFAVRWVFLWVLNIAALPGALVAWGSSDKSKTTARAIQFIIGVIISAIGMAYVYLAWVALVVIFTKQELSAGGLFRPVIWPMALSHRFYRSICLRARRSGKRQGSSNGMLTFTRCCTLKLQR